MDYKNGKIYRLVCNVSGKQYVGSTTQPLSKRKSTHKANYNQWKNNNRGYTSSFEIIDGGNCDIVLIENYPCSNKEELHARERFFIESVECVNKNIPTRTKKEYIQDNKQHIQQIYTEWENKNRDKRNEQRRNRYDPEKRRLRYLGARG